MLLPVNTKVVGVNYNRGIVGLTSYFQQFEITFVRRLIAFVSNSRTR
jgi:hypothetical protein